MIKLYSTNCPKCKVLETKLNMKGIQYDISTDVNEMLAMGIKAAPVLQLDNGKLLLFADAVKWVNGQ